MLIFNLAAAALARRHRQHQWVRLTSILDCFWRASIMSEVFPGTDLKCEEITVAVYRMQNLQLLSNTGQKRCKYNAEYIWTHSIFYRVDLEVELFLRIPVDLLLLTWICHPHLYSIGPILFQKTLNDGKVLYVFNRDTLYTRLLFVLFQDEMLFCDSCDRGFHMECCNPPLSRMPKGEVFTLSGFSGCLSAVISKPFLHRWPYGAVTQQTVRQRWLIRSFACISNDSSIPGEVCYLWITVLTLQQGL